MKPGKIAIFLVALGLLIPLRSVAQTTSNPTTSSSPASGSTAQIRQTFTGTVLKIDEKAGKLTMKTWDNQQKEFSIDSTTALTLGSTAAKFSELKAGQQIILTAQGNKAVSVALSTTNLQGATSNKNQTSSNATERSPGTNQGVDPYRSPGSTTEARPQASGERMTQSPSSSEVQGLRSPNSSPGPSSASAQGTGSSSMPPAAAQGTSAQATGSANAQAAPPASSPSAGASEQTEEKVTGSVVSVDSAANQITVKTPEGRLRVFSVDFSTKYNLNAAAGMLSDLKEGQSITITAKGMKALSVDTNTSTR